MPQHYDGRKHPNKLRAPCIGCGARTSKKWAGTGPYACTSRACQRKLAEAAPDAAAPSPPRASSGEDALLARDDVALADFADLLDALPEAASSPSAAASPRSPARAGRLVDAVVQTDEDTIDQLRRQVAEQQELIEHMADERATLVEQALEDLEAAHVELQEKENLLRLMSAELVALRAARSQPKPTPHKPPPGGSRAFARPLSAHVNLR